MIFKILTENKNKKSNTQNLVSLLPNSRNTSKKNKKAKFLLGKKTELPFCRHCTFEL